MFYCPVPCLNFDKISRHSSFKSRTKWLTTVEIPSDMGKFWTPWSTVSIWKKKIIFGNFNFVDDTVKVILESKYRSENCWFYKFLAQI